jgi:hypothetical protein
MAAVMAFMPSAAPAMSASYNDWIIVPGVRVGPIGKYTSAAALKSMIPNADIRHTRDQHGDRTDVTYRTSNRQAKQQDMRIRWAKRHRVIRQITIYQYAGPWRTAAGIRMGTSVDSVQYANGQQFTLLYRRTFLHAKTFGGGKVSQHVEFAFRRANGGAIEAMPAQVKSDHPKVKGRDFRIIAIVVHFR